MKVNDEVRFYFETKRKLLLIKILGEELLRRIRERHSKTTKKESDDVLPPPSTSISTHLLVPPV